MNKYEFFSREEVTKEQNTLKHILTNRFYNLWMNKFNWNGLDEDIKDKQENFIMRKFWTDGTVACRKERRTGTLVFTPWTRKDVDLYDFPITVNLVKLHAASDQLVPSTTQVVDKDVVLVWSQPNHKPIKETVDWYVDRMVQIEMVTNTNLNLHKIPFLIETTNENEKQIKDIINRILNNEVAVFTGVKQINSINAVVTGTPYIMDKLRSMYVSYENELLTYLGIDNSGSGEKKAQLLVDEVNANNDVINNYGDAIYNEIHKGIERINRTFERSITIENKDYVQPTQSDFESNDIVEEKKESEGEGNE